MLCKECGTPLQIMKSFNHCFERKSCVNFDCSLNNIEKVTTMLINFKVGKKEKMQLKRVELKRI